MAQRYTHPVALSRMAIGMCPECGELPDEHSQVREFWLRSGCDLLPDGVTERINQYRADQGGTQ